MMFLDNKVLVAVRLLVVVDLLENLICSNIVHMLVDLKVKQLLSKKKLLLFYKHLKVNIYPF